MNPSGTHGPPGVRRLVRISTCGTGFASWLAVYTGSLLDSLHRVATGQGGCEPCTETRLTSQRAPAPGTSIAVAGAFPEQEGPFDLLIFDPLASPPPAGAIRRRRPRPETDLLTETGAEEVPEDQEEEGAAALHPPGAAEGEAARLGEGLRGAAAEVRVEHPGDLARDARRRRGPRRRSGRWRGSRRAARRTPRSRIWRTSLTAPAVSAPGPQSTIAVGSRARRARSSRSSPSSLESISTRKPARRRVRSSAWAWTASASEPRLESSSRIPAGREAAEARRRAPCSQPVAQREANSSSASRSGSTASRSIAGSSSSSTVRSSGRSARLSSTARSAASSSKLSQGGEQAVVAGRRGLALAGQLDRRGDVAGLGERVAQGLQLDQLVVAVVARRCASASGSRSGAPSCAACWG